MLSMLFWSLFHFVAVSSAAEPAAEAVDERRVMAEGYPLYSVLGPLLDDRLFREADIALQIVDVKTGDEVFAWDADRSLVPASTMKVVTAAASLRQLGPNYRFHTALLSDAEVDEDGLLKGNLYVRGTGDPTLVVEKLWKMLVDLKVRGIKSIEGDVILDDSWFSDGPLIPGWRKKVDIANGPAYFAPLGALSINHNALAIVVSPGTEPTAAPFVRLETPSELVEFDNQMTTVAAGKRGWVQIDREADAQTGKTRFVVSGEIAADADSQWHYRAVANPLAWFGATLSELLQQQGIKVGGTITAGGTPAEAEEIVRLWSPPLHEILNHTNKYSSNFMAEHILKALGAEAKGAPGTAEKGLEVIREYLDELGIARDEYTIVNGSGLSRKTALRPSHLNAVLMDMYHEPLLAPEFASSLAVSGRDGTLRGRFDGEDNTGRVRGKTGSLNGVYCLAAYFRAQSGDTYAMTILVNRFRRTRPVRALHDRFGEALLGVSEDLIEQGNGVDPEGDGTTAPE